MKVEREADGARITLDRAELHLMQRALEKAFSKKPKALELNRVAVDAGLAYAKQNLPKKDPFRVERLDIVAILQQLQPVVARGELALVDGVLLARDGRPFRRPRCRSRSPSWKCARRRSSPAATIGQATSSTLHSRHVLLVVF